MKAVALNAYPRSATRRGGAKRLRAEGRVPAVIYGRRAPAENLELKLKEIEDLLHHSASTAILVELGVAGGSEARRLALVQEVQHHPLSGHVLHVDFHQVAEDERVTVTLPVESVGEAIGVKTGNGVLEHVLFKVKVRGLPKDLPEVIEVDVSNLEIGQAVHLGDISMPAGIELLGDKAIPVLAVAAPITEAQEAASLESGAAPLTEPEVLTEKKEGKEGVAPAAEGADKKAVAGGEKKGAEKKPAEKKA
jgi:large subunit ribosomal protein L25